MGTGEIKLGTTETACTAFKGISWSKMDTRPTQDEVTEHNGVYKRLCMKGN